MKSLVPGAEIAGYLLEDVLGRGGMGVVWRAKQIALERPVALKVLAQELAEDQEFRFRFEREAKLAARIRHPNVVIVYDAREASGVLVLAMELVKGSDLASVLGEHGPLPVPRAIKIIEQVAGALDAAHAEDLVHRDVKPANVLIAGSGEDEHAYLTDFGLTKALTEAASEGLTRRGTIVGTPGYMAPEQVKGEDVGERADIYALGCILFELLAGKQPYVRDTEVATLFAHVNDAVPSLRELAPQLPAELDSVVGRAMAKAPEDRFLSAGELARAARGAIDGVAAAAEPREQRTVISLEDAVWEGHAAVAGLGASGSRLAIQLDDAGYRVVAIELDGSSEGVVACRERGIPVLVGDATDPELLASAQITNARHLIVTCGNDARNIDVAMVAEKQLQAERPNLLTALVHLRDIDLLRAMKVETVRGGGRRDFRLEFFNPRATGTRLLLDRHPPFEDIDGTPLTAPGICVVGDNTVASNLILLTAAEWRQVRPLEERLPVVVAGPGASELVDALTVRHPRLAEVCLLEARPAEIQSARFQSGEVLLDSDGRCRVTRAYVALEDESRALEATLGLHAQPATEAIPIVVALDDDEGPMADVLRAKGRAFARSVEPFGILSSALTPTLLMRGVNELLARANHEVYLREQRARGVSEGASMVPWEDLPESLKNSNRRFADGIGAVLVTLGCSLAPTALAGGDGPPVAFSDEEVEELARGEHERWMADLIRDGWQFHSGEKDPERKLHPLLVPWSELDEMERDKDRDAVRSIPQTLDRAGFEVIRPRGESAGKSAAVGAAANRQE